ncbi:hypothetical protein ACF07D_04795 [Leucobacter sp. NPDC015123]|uniref:hypothetical protein n=1 Tax=Leucobacter sp. NPDC015123 TaxID=3364129 RepID=UPI0036F46FA0
MAREHANIRLDMWGDGDWRALSMQAQWLYKLLLTHPKTNRAGVCDWRPKRLAAMATGISAADVEAMATELIAGYFIVVDEDTEEVAVRSYVKHDGVMKQPNMAVTMANDWTGVASERIRAVIAFEVQKLKIEQPGLPGWKSERHLETILSFSGVDVKNDPSVDPSVEGGSMGRTTTTATSTTTATHLQEGGALAAPSLYCSRHPAGTDQPCRGCKVAGEAFEKWAAGQDAAPEPREHVHDWFDDGTCLGCDERREDTT